MKNAILLHGTTDKEEYFSDKYPSLSNSHWFPWLQKQLLINSISAQTPELPNAYNPVYEEWKKEFERNDINQDTILVGHSCGAGFLVRWLSENNKKVDKVALVAPWLDPENAKNNSFFDFKIDEHLISKANSMYILYSTDDMESVIKSVDMLKNTVKDINIISFEGKGHFCLDDMGTDRFPELLKLLV